MEGPQKADTVKVSQIIKVFFRWGKKDEWNKWQGDHLTREKWETYPKWALLNGSLAPWPPFKGRWNNVIPPEYSAYVIYIYIKQSTSTYINGFVDSRGFICYLCNSEIWSYKRCFSPRALKRPLYITRNIRVSFLPLCKKSSTSQDSTYEICSELLETETTNKLFERWREISARTFG